MKQQKDNWVKILFSFAAPCKGKMALSVFCAILSVAGGFIPFWAVYEILLAFINQNVTLNGILIWCLVGAVGYLLRVSYDGSEQNEVLHDVNLELPEGSFTALVGPSGGGKSTIARLIARFWDVTGGNITIGGKNIKELSIRQLSELVSFVTQDNFLFNCSLKENIRLGNPNATDEEVYAAAKAACCDEFIVRLDKGYDTPAGDAGKRLSGGEKQRIAIARAILKNAPIVILDEATAFTDPQNEDKIQKSIMALSKGKTLLVIAHRLSTIQNADQIVVLKKGRIVDCGKQKELLKRCPLYADMWKAHIGAKNWSVSEKKEVAAHV